MGRDSRKGGRGFGGRSGGFGGRSRGPGGRDSKRSGGRSGGRSSGGFRGRSSGGSRGRDFGQKFDATCANCGKACQLPFRPTGRKPVLCSDCFKKSGDRDRSNSGSVSPDQIKKIDKKLDRILKILSELELDTSEDDEEDESEEVVMEEEVEVKSKDPVMDEEIKSKDPAEDEDDESEDQDVDEENGPKESEE